MKQRSLTPDSIVKCQRFLKWVLTDSEFWELCHHRLFGSDMEALTRVKWIVDGNEAYGR
jgi:hypothetical protein